MTTWSEGRVWSIGLAAIGCISALLLAILSALVIAGGEGSLGEFAPISIAVAILGAAGWVAILKRPVVHLSVLLAGFVVLFNSEQGIQASEALFGVYYLGYLFAWFVRHVAFGDVQLVRDRLDLMLMLFLALVTVQAFTAPLYGGDTFLALNQWRCSLILGYYFPIREMVRKSPEALAPLASAFIAAALYLTFRNLYLYLSGLRSAEAIYELVFNRSRAGERIYAVAMVGAIVFAVRQGASPMARLIAFLIAVATGGAIIGGMSRTIWVAIAPAIGVLLLVFNRREWRAVGWFMALTVIGLALAIPLFLGNAFEAVSAGLVLRAGSIATSASADLSLINRFYEWRAAIGAGLKSPLIGRGFGVPYSFFDILYRATDTRPFSHSTYVGLFYRHGIVGLGLFLGVYLTAAWRAFLLTRAETGLRRSFALTSLGSIALLSISVSTEGTLLITDGVYALMYPLAFVGALWWSRPAATA